VISYNGRDGVATCPGAATGLGLLWSGLCVATCPGAATGLGLLWSGLCTVCDGHLSAGAGHLAPAVSSTHGWPSGGRFN